MIDTLLGTFSNFSSLLKNEDAYLKYGLICNSSISSGCGKTFILVSFTRHRFRFGDSSVLKDSLHVHTPETRSFRHSTQTRFLNSLLALASSCEH